MPFTFYLSSENQLSIQDVEVLQNAARANDTGNIIIGDRQLSVRYQSVDWPPESPDNQYHLNK